MIGRLAILMGAGGVGLALALVLGGSVIGGGREVTVNPWRAKVRNGFLLPALVLWLVVPMGPISFNVVTFWAALLVATVVFDVVGWDWRGLFRRTEKVASDAA
jgi:hypothetical protein